MCLTYTLLCVPDGGTCAFTIPAGNVERQDSIVAKDQTGSVMVSWVPCPGWVSMSTRPP
jgi:hypothetical protein